MRPIEEEEDSSAHPSKRRRGVGTSTSQSRPTSALGFWFDDGDIVLEVEQYMFKIHQNVLQCSVIFFDMLRIPQPDVIDRVDGCPLVQLTDSAQDWHAVLKWMYDPRSYDVMSHPVPFPLISSTLRIASKYEIAALRKWAVDRLHLRWPSDLERMDTTSLPCAAEAITLANECEVPEILPAAFYALSIPRWGYNAEGGRSHLVLSSADMRRLVVGREKLHEFRCEILLDPLVSRPSGPPFESCAQCQDALRRYWREKLSSDPNSPFECWLLREIYMVATEGNDLFHSSLCAPCLAWHRDVAWNRFYGLKASIPRFFCLT